MTDFTMPSLGADMAEGTLAEWKVKPGDTVRRGDIVAVVETQKGAIDVEIFADGVIEALLVEPGTTVPVGTVLARVSGPGAAQTVPSHEAAPRGEVRPRASPGAKAAARELGADLRAIKGTGAGGAITREDVERAAKAGAVAPATPAGPQSRPGMRQAIAAAMARSKREIPHYYLATDIDMSAALEWLRLYNEPRKPAGRLLPLVLLLKAVALAARSIPEVNGFFENGVFRPGKGVHLGVAISLREGGLVVPALHDADTQPLDALGRGLADLIERARRGQLRGSELTDGTLTVTSLGDRGVETVYGVIFPPQVAIVGFGKIAETPRVAGGQCVPRPTLTATLAADHRVSDGHRGGLFLAEIASLLQKPEAL